jgi:hypothetical protein
MEKARLAMIAIHFPEVLARPEIAIYFNECRKYENIIN